MLRDPLAVGAVGQPLPVHVTAEQEEPVRPVLGHETRPQDLGQAAEPAPAPDIHLPETVAGGVEALYEEGVVVRARIDVRHAPGVHEDLRGTGEPRDRMRHVGRGAGLCAGPLRNRQRQDCRRQRTQRLHEGASCGDIDIVPAVPRGDVARLIIVSRVRVLRRTPHTGRRQREPIFNIIYIMRNFVAASGRRRGDMRSRPPASSPNDCSGRVLWTPRPSVGSLSWRLERDQLDACAFLRGASTFWPACCTLSQALPGALGQRCDAVVTGTVRWPNPDSAAASPSNVLLGVVLWSACHPAAVVVYLLAADSEIRRPRTTTYGRPDIVKAEVAAVCRASSTLRSFRRKLVPRRGHLRSQHVML